MHFLLSITMPRMKQRALQAISCSRGKPAASGLKMLSCLRGACRARDKSGQLSDCKAQIGARPSSSHAWYVTLRAAMCNNAAFCF